MCGIFGVASLKQDILVGTKPSSAKFATEALLKASQIRGSNAAGIFAMTKRESVLYKDGVPARNFINHAQFNRSLNKVLYERSSFKCLIGHTRAQTKGSYNYNHNNHPIHFGRIVGVHNGMISNDDNLFRELKIEGRQGVVDSEVIFALIHKFREEGKSLALSVQKANALMVGSCACAFVDIENPRYLNLYYEGTITPIVIYVYDESGLMAFASTERILKEALDNKEAGCLQSNYASYKIELKSAGLRIDLDEGKFFKYDLELNSSSALHG